MAANPFSTIVNPYGNAIVPINAGETVPAQSISAIPSLVPYDELPVYGSPPPDRKWLIDQIVRELDNGVFVSAGRLGDSILRDGRIMGAFEQRNAGLFGSELTIESADEENEQANEIRDEIEDDWEVYFPRSTLEEIHQNGIMHGICIVEKVWDTSQKPWKIKLNVFHPQFYMWRWDTRSYWVLTLDRQLVDTALNPRQWMVYTPYGYKRAFLRGRLRSLVDPWMMRCWDKNDWAHWCEIHGTPIRKAIVPQQADPKQERDYVNAISNIGSNTVIKARQDKDGNKYDIELVEAMSMGWKGFEAMMSWCDKEISLVLLGQAMSTDGQGGLSAQEKPGDAVRNDIKQADNERLTEVLYTQILRDYCEVNYANPDLAPRPSYQVDPPEDTASVALVHSNQATADNIYIQSGVLTPEEVALSRFGAGEYSLSTEIDAESRQRILDVSIKQLEQEAQNELEAANDPQPTPGTMHDQMQQQQPKGKPEQLKLGV